MEFFPYDRRNFVVFLTIASNRTMAKILLK